MALGRRPKRRAQEFWTPTDRLPRSPGHPFYRKLNEILRGDEFDRYVEELCEPFYADGDKGRPSIPPGVYFRMLFVGYFEGIDSQRGIAWRCADSMSVREFLGLVTTDNSPHHSSLGVIRNRLSLEVHEQVFAYVLTMAEKRGLIKGKAIAVDSTLLEANAAMKSIVRRDTGEDWTAYVKRLAEESGMENPTDEDVRRFDGKRKKKVSNKEWVSSTDPSSEITKMKDGRTHLAYKCEHAIDLESELLLSIQIAKATQSDASMLVGSVREAQANLIAAGSSSVIEEVVADKGYHSTQALTECSEQGVRTYVPERKSTHRRKWKKRSKEERKAVTNNHRRVQGNRSKKMQRLRSEKVERSFAHTCDTGGARRTWLAGLIKIKKRYSIHAAGRNLGRIMFLLFGIGTPRGLQTPVSAVEALLQALHELNWRVRRALCLLGGIVASSSARARFCQDICVNPSAGEFAA